MALRDWPEVNPAWQGGPEVEDVRRILAFKAEVMNETLERLREEKVIGQPLDAEVELRGNPEEETFASLLRRAEGLEEFFIVSSVTLTEDPSHDGPPTAEARHATGERCPRSWRWVPELETVEPWGAVSPRCAAVLRARAEPASS